MADRADALFAWLSSIPDPLLYLLLGVAAGLENIVPPIPADVMVLAGGVLAGAGGADPLTLFFAVWAGNVSSALAIYGLGRRYGGAFFSGSLGHFLLAPRQLHALRRAYRRYGFPIIFISRFLPVFRPIVPVFAGVSKVPFPRAAIPIAGASAIWYGLLVYVGVMAGENLEAVIGILGRVGGWLWAVAATILLALAVWWRRTRREPPGTGAGE